MNRAYKAPYLYRASHVALKGSRHRPVCLEGSDYLLVVDYLSVHCPPVHNHFKRSHQTAEIVFVWHGVSSKMVSDNGPQYGSLEFATFAKNYELIHQTSSPRYSQSNGEAERAVKTINSLLVNTEDPFLVLMAILAL